MKTILHAIDTKGPGGAETVFMDLASLLPKHKYRSLAVITGKGWVHDELCRRGIDPIIINTGGSFDWRYLKGLIKIINLENVDLIQSHLLGSGVYCSLAGLITRKPVIATFHGAVDISDRERLKSSKFRIINLGASRIIAVSNNLSRNIAHRTPLNTSKTTVIYNGINIADFHTPHSEQLRRQFGWLENDIIIGCLGNIRSAKGYDILLRAAAILKDKSTNYKFVIAGQGKGSLYDNLLEQRRHLHLDEIVQFLGFCDDPAVFLSNLDLFVLSSTSEGFSIATIQAMATGLPVIVTRSGGPEEIVSHGKNGWMVEPGNPGAIAEAIELLINNKELSTELAENGRNHASQNFNLNTMLEAYSNIYDEFI